MIGDQEKRLVLCASNLPILDSPPIAPFDKGIGVDTWFLA